MKHDTLTPAEQETRLEDMALTRCKEIAKARRERVKLRKVAARKIAQMLSKTHHLERCKECTAMRFYLKNGKKP